jgi:hypothetical protein
MGWELRSGKRYFYKKWRVGDRVVSDYWGRNEMAELLAEDAEENRFIATTQGEIKREERNAESDVDRQLAEEATLLAAIVGALLCA